jgi:uncharacterized membrane protein
LDAVRRSFGFKESLKKPRRHTMSINIYRIAAVALLITVAALAGILLTQHTASAATAKTVTVVHTADQVDSYNDGYATAEQSDCQQGYAPACAWLRSN